MKKIKVPVEDGILIIYTKNLFESNQITHLHNILKGAFENDKNKFLVVPYEHIEKIRFLPRKKK